MKRIYAIILGLVLALASPAMAFADHIDGKTGWYVEYNSAGELTDNYTQLAWADNMSQLQPGDDITLTVEIRQNNDSSAEWYLTNEVLKSLEDGEAKGSAYGYKLEYIGPSDSRTLYESKSVGGTGSAEGLAEATNAMNDYFYLGTLNKGETAKVVLNVALDGETEGNAYFDTLAQLSLKFAVEPNVTTQDQIDRNTTIKKEETVTKDQVVNETKTVDKNQTVNTTKDTTSNRTVSEDKVVDEVVTVNRQQGSQQESAVNRIISGDRTGLTKTGDRTTLFPLYLAIAGLGIVCLALAIRNLRKKDDDKGGAQ